MHAGLCACRGCSFRLGSVRPTPVLMKMVICTACLYCFWSDSYRTSSTGWRSLLLHTLSLRRPVLRSLLPVSKAAKFLLVRILTKYLSRAICYVITSGEWMLPVRCQHLCLRVPSTAIKTHIGRSFWDLQIQTVLKGISRQRTVRSS